MTDLTPVQQDAYNSINKSLETGFLNGVNEDDLNSVRSTLSDLGATDADAVIDAMAENGLLQKLANESNDGEFLGIGQDGFSTDERRSLFTDLAGKLDGESLAAVSNAFAKAEKGHEDFNVVTELADAVASHSSSQTKLDYINELKGSVDGEGFTDIMIGAGSATRNVDSEAGAIGTVIGSMSGTYAEAALTSLSDDQLAAVLKTGIDENVYFTGGSVVSNFSTERFSAVLDAAASTGNADLKAKVFDAAAEPLRTVRDADNFPAVSINDQNMKDMTGAMSRLIESDTTGVVRELTYNTATQDGSALSAYSQVMIETGQTEKLADHMNKLQFGNDGNENAIDRLDEVTTRGGQDYRENAGSLGYFVGAVYSGAKANSSDVKDQQEVVKGFLGFVLDKIPGNAKDAMLGQDLVGKAVEAAINDPGAAPAQLLERAALPQDANGELSVGDNVTNAFDTTINRVIRSSEP